MMDREEMVIVRDMMDMMVKEMMERVQQPGQFDPVAENIAVHAREARMAMQRMINVVDNEPGVFV